MARKKIALDDPLDKVHPQYAEFLDDWCKCRDVIAGEKAVKGKRAKYLPLLDGKDAQVYQSYLDRALFYNATARTVDGYEGSVFRKTPEIKLPAIIESMRDKVDAGGNTLVQFLKQAVTEVIKLNRSGLLLDYPKQAAANEIPYVCHYSAEDIRDWRTSVIGGRAQLTFLVLAELEDMPGQNGFGHEVSEIRRVLRLTPPKTENGVYTYTVERWKKTADDDKFMQIEPPSEVVIRGNTLDYIPFIFISDDDLTADVKKPSLIDLVNVNLSHYRTSADLEHGAHYTALPTPALSGFSEDQRPGKVPLGPTEAIILPLQGEAKMLEFTGQGLKALEDRALSKEKMMAVLGARLLQEQKTGVETAETQRLRQSADKSILANIVDNVNEAMRRVLKWATVWAGGQEPDDKELLVKINDEFFEQMLNGVDVVNLVKGWQGGAYSHDSLLRKLQKGGVIERSPEDEREQMDEEGPPNIPGVTDQLGQDQNSQDPGGQNNQP